MRALACGVQAPACSMRHARRQSEQFSGLRRRQLARAVALLAAMNGGCAVFADPPQTALLRAVPPGRLPRRIEHGEAPFLAQARHQCGPATLAMALRHVGLHGDPDDLARAVFLPGREGSLQIEMMVATRRAGAVATLVRGELQSLFAELAAGHVVIVLQNLGLDIAPRWHYALVIGYDLDRRELILRSGEEVRQVLALRTFEHTWARAAHWAMRVSPRD